MECWQFIQSPAGGWYWVCSDVLSRKTRTSEATFQTRTECVTDAMGYGYQKVAMGAGHTTSRHAPSRHVPPRHRGKPKATKHKRS
jgi:hypothetical protein